MRNFLFRAQPSRGPRATVTTTTAVPSSGAGATSTSTRVAPAPAQPAANTSEPPPPAATPVAPASDLQTRQLRLLPWQTSASPARQASASPAPAEREDASTSLGRPASPPLGGAASSADSANGDKAQPRRLPAGSLAAGAVPPGQAGPVCEVCGGKGYLRSGRRVQPCLACQQWRQRPDYSPGASLLTLQDVDLAVLDGSASGAAGSPGSPVSSESSGEEGPSASGDGATAVARRPRRRAGPMPAEQREAISRALQSKGAKSAEHRRSISRAMREAHARNPNLRRSAAGLKKRCGYCGQEGHNRRSCPQLAAASAGTAPTHGPPAPSAVPANKLIVIEEVDEVAPAQAGAAPAASVEGSSSSSGGVAGITTPAGSSGSASAGPQAPAPPAASGLDASTGSADAAASAAPRAAASAPVPPSGGAQALGPLADLVPSRRLAPGMSLSAEGDWIFSLPRTKEECVAQAAQAVLRAWDDGIRRQAVELLLPQADPNADGGWPGGIRQQFRVAKPMVEAMLLRLKQHRGLSGRITAEFLDEGDCVGAWQSERLGAVLFATADTLEGLRRIDDALSGQRLTLVVNPQWQTQGQVISDFGIGRARKAAERFVSAFEESYYLRRVRVFGDDVRILRCYPGLWQVHYVASEAPSDTVLVSCEDAKPTFQRLIELLKAVRGTRASKTWLDRVLTSSMGSFNEFAAYQAQGAGAGAAAGSGEGTDASSTAKGREIDASGGSQGESGEAAAGPGQERDIVTGEVLPPAVEGKAPRDIRLQPVHEIAKWLP